MPDPKKRIVVDGVEFGSLFQFPRILGSVTASMQPPRLVVALLMVVAIVVFGRTWDSVAGPSVSPGGLLSGAITPTDSAAVQEVLWQTIDTHGLVAPGLRESVLDHREVLTLLAHSYQVQRDALDDPAADGDPAAVADLDERFRVAVGHIEAIAPQGVFAASLALVVDCVQRTVQGVIWFRPQMVLGAAADLFMRAPPRLWSVDRAFALVGGLFVLIVLAIGGGALSRMAACEIAGREQLRVRDAVDFALKGWLRLILTPVLPLLLAGGLALLIMLFGVLLAPWLDVVGGPLYGIALLLGFVLTFLLLGYALGFPLLLPAVACENCDASDAQQRAYAYVLGRPLHLIGYLATAIVGLALGYVIVALVAAVTLNVVAGVAGTLTNNAGLAEAGGFSLFDLRSTDAAAAHATGHSAWAGAAISFWQRLVVELVAAYVVAYFFTGSTMVYLLLRRACDGQDVEEIWRPGMAPGTMMPVDPEVAMPARPARQDKRDASGD